MTAREQKKAGRPNVVRQPKAADFAAEYIPRTKVFIEQKGFTWDLTDREVIR